jgi:glycolate oxidase FAD binding subunit
MSTTLEELSARIADAARDRTPLSVRGGASKAFYGRAQTGEPLHTSGYSGIVDYEPAELVVTVRAGTRLAELESTLAERGQMLAFEPPGFSPEATVGGCVAAGLSGPRRAFVGSVRDFVLGVRIVDGRGRQLSFGGRVIKNVAGYDVSRLMAGALGTLGVITEVSFKVLPIPVEERHLEFECTPDEAIRRVNEWGGKPLPLSATWYSGGRLRVRLSGAKAAVSTASATLGGVTESYGAEFWRQVREHELDAYRIDATGAAALWRLSVPSAAAPLAVPGEQTIEWGGALRWLKSTADAAVVRSAAARAGGHATLFRSPRPADDVFHPLAPGIDLLQRNLKKAFDPMGILNPGRMYRE